MKTFFLSSLLFLMYMQGHTQEMQIGEKFPDIQLTNVVNYSAPSLKLSDFNKKLIILDFWSTSCSGCVSGFPKIDLLQKEFGTNVQFILVNTQGRDSTIRFFKKHRKIKMPAVPLVTADTLLKKLFPYETLPMHVWVDQDRKVRYITSGYNATQNHLATFLAGENLQLDRKMEIKDYDRSKPQFAQGNNSYADKVLYYSLIAHYIPGITIGNDYPQRSNGVIQISPYCKSIVDLFKEAFTEYGKYDFRAANTVIFQTTDSLHYFSPTNPDLRDTWTDNYAYNYKLVLPESKSADFYNIMQQDLQRFFDLSAHVEKRKIKAMVLVRTSTKDKIAASRNNLKQEIANLPQGSHIFREMAVDRFVLVLRELFNFNSDFTVFDQTSYSEKITLALNDDVFDPFNLEGLKKELNKFDLDLVEKEVMADVLVIEQTTIK